MGRKSNTPFFDKSRIKLYNNHKKRTVFPNPIPLTLENFTTKVSILKQKVPKYKKTPRLIAGSS